MSPQEAINQAYHRLINQLTKTRDEYLRDSVDNEDFADITTEDAYVWLVESI